MWLHKNEREKKRYASNMPSTKLKANNYGKEKKKKLICKKNKSTFRPKSVIRIKINS